MRNGSLSPLVPLLLLLLPHLAAARDHGPLDLRVEQVRALIGDQPKDERLREVFAPAFLKAIPPSKAREFLRDYYGKGGAVTAVVRLSSQGAHAAAYRFFTGTKVFPVTIGVAAEPPHQIVSLWFGALSPRHRSLDQVRAALQALPGQVSFAVCKLGAGEPKLLSSLQPDLSLALGSTFKLFVLGALVEAINRGERRWDEVIALRQDWKSWPSGSLHRWPAGSPITLSTLAQLMISVSDNTATDHLLRHLGRPAVEAMLTRMGVKRPERSQPFLTTRELFLLHADPARLASYLERDRRDRRAFLDQVVGKIAWQEHMDYAERPTAIDQVEWFASASDLCRSLDWLRRQARGPKTRLALETLAINRTELSFRDSAWRYIGYKGGSEPGVLNLSWLLQHQSGEWLVLTAGWNDRKSSLADGRLEELMQSAILLLEEGR